MEINHEQFNVTLDRLVRDEANARKRYDKDSIKSMKASILADGIIQPLAVRPPQASDTDLGGQLYRVYAGGRRLRAMEELIAEKALPAGYEVPVIVRDVDDARAAGMSLAENVIRRNMDPVDEFRAFKDLVDKGATVADVALRFGQTKRFVRGRMALGGLHPQILEAFENEKISFAAVTAYTASPDPEAQLAAFTSLGWQNNNVHSVKSTLQADVLKSTSKICLFIGEERYREAGGIVEEDLFGDEIYWTSPDIVSELKGTRLAEEREKALLEGWQFFETDDEFGSDIWHIRGLAPTQVDLPQEDMDRMDEISEELENTNRHHLEGDELAAYHVLNAEYEALEAKASTYTDEQKAVSGVVVSLERLEYRYAVMRKGDEEAAQASAKVPGDEKPKKSPLDMTQPLKDMIGTAASDALKLEVAAKPALALALLAAMLEQSGDTGMGTGRPSRLKVEKIDYDAKSEVKKRSVSTAFASYAKMKAPALQKAVAELFAGTVDLTEKWFQKDFTQDAVRDKTRSAFLEAFEVNPINHFAPDAFFTSCTKPMINAAMKEMTGEESTKPKKSEMAIEAAAYAVKTGWLPKGLRLKGYKITKV